MRVKHTNPTTWSTPPGRPPPQRAGSSLRRSTRSKPIGSRRAEWRFSSTRRDIPDSSLGPSPMGRGGQKSGQPGVGSTRSRPSTPCWSQDRTRSSEGSPHPSTWVVLRGGSFQGGGVGRRVGGAGQAHDCGRNSDLYWGRGNRGKVGRRVGPLTRPVTAGGVREGVEGDLR